MSCSRPTGASRGPRPGSWPPRSKMHWRSRSGPTCPERRSSARTGRWPSPCPSRRWSRTRRSEPSVPHSPNRTGDCDAPNVRTVPGPSTGDDPFPLGRLLYLYVGSSDVRADLAWYDEVLGADLVWHFEAFGAHVAAVQVGPEGSALVLLADHRPVPSCLPIWAVRSLHDTSEWLHATGWPETAERAGGPGGP